MNQTQTAKLSVVFLSLLYFLPLITMLLMGHIIPFREIPALAYLLFIIVALFLLLPGIGTLLYVQIANPDNRFILLAVASAVFAVVFIFFTLASGFTPSGINGSVQIFLFFLLPIFLLILIPAWFTIPHADEPLRIPQILAVLAPILALFFIYFYFQRPDCPVGAISPAYSPLVMPIFFGATVIVSIILGILLLYRGITHPDIK
ncbi:hypothetical protein [Methanorbis furvi]|uniref:Uncharacterized protein n=1 Tax=Methanorbis furvi TaxID=3028299 RepID=A0AAE4SBJ4_9EURY|nr:hypothetical protein [Methanocorpusculaceae archaeon Ag1]